MDYQKITKSIPYEHQKQALDRGRDLYSFAYFLEMGCGKSLICIMDFMDKFIQREIDSVVIVAPKGCYLNWPLNELPAHMPTPNYWMMSWKAPSSRTIKENREMDYFAKTPIDKLKILCVNVEAFSGDTAPEYVKKFLIHNTVFMVVDESTSIRNPSSKRSKSIIKLGSAAKYKRILTGTPIAESPLDVFGQCAFLGKDLLGHKSMFSFKHYYANIINIPLQGGRTFPKLIGYRRLDELTSDLDKFSFRVLKKDCLDLPEKIYQNYYIDPTTEQRNVYNDMAKKMLATIKGEQCTAQIALTKLMRLQGILCGHIKFDNGDTGILDSNRVSTLFDLLPEIYGKVIVWCKWRMDIELIIEQAKKDNVMAVQYHGDLDNKDRTESLDLFKNNSDCKLFVATQETASKGLTLNHASTNIYFSQGYSLEHRAQSEDRSHRIGQKNNVTYIDFICPGTVDQKIIDAIKAKKDLERSVLDNLESYFQPI